MTRRARQRRRRQGRGETTAIAPAMVVLTVLVAGFLFVTVSRLAGARHDLVLVRSDLKAARDALSLRDDATANAVLDRADRRLNAAKADASSFTVRLTRKVPLLGSPGRALLAATRAGRDGVAAGRIMVEASSSFPTSASATVQGQDLGPFHTAARRSQTAVNEADHRLEAAAATLRGPSKAALPPISGPARAMTEEIEKGRAQLAGAARVLSLLADLTAADANLRLLVLSQDTLELRPTGGFIGSYGLLRFSNGTAKLEKYEATEDLPDAVPPMAPPEGLSTYLIRPWSLSNVNWSPDFPKTATLATEMFRRQGGGDVDGVLALTELATARLIGALGSLQLPSYPKPVVEDGFDTRVVYEVELKKPPDIPRKKYLVELANVLFDRLFHLPAEKLPGVADAVRRSVGAGDIQMWFKDPARQQLVVGSDVAGSLPEADGDFLMLVDANLTASKSNLEVTKLVDYRVDRDGEGRLVGHVRVELRNEGVESPVNPLYNAYLRVYAPAGARLLSPGFDTKQLGRDGPFEVFAQPLIVLPKQQGVATFDYLLPETVPKGEDYTLTWVRQAGTPRDQLRLVVGGRTAATDTSKRSFTYRGGL